MLIRNVADEVVGRNVQINAIGTNFLDSTGFLAANRAFVDGTSRFTTGQFIGFAGGWV